MARKTFDVAEFTKSVNDLLSAEKSTIDGRQAAISLLCDVLHKTGNYRGFSYLYSHELPHGVEPGIIFDESGNGNHSYPDKTRCRYYVK